MTLLDDMRRVYKITVKCENCGEIFELSIPKGITAEAYMKEQGAKCITCGCTTLRKLSNLARNPWGRSY